MMRAICTVSLVLAAACTANDTPADAATDETASAASCPIIDSRDWTAWVDAQPGVDRSTRTLHIRGQADMPTPGYAYEWRVGAADRMMPPGQHMHLDVTAPDGMVIQVVTPMEIRYEGAAAYPEYRKIVVHCGDAVIAEIDEVVIAQQHAALTLR